MATLFVVITILIDHEETWKHTNESGWCYVLFDVWIMWILKKKLVNDNIVLDVFIICQKLRHIQVIEKNVILILIDSPSYSPKCPQSAANDVEGVEYRRLHHVWIWHLMSHIHSAWHLTYNWVSIALYVLTIELTVLYCSV